MYIKQEQSDAKNNDMLILNAIEDLAENGQEFTLGADEVISSTENICMELGNAQVSLIPIARYFNCVCNKNMLY